MLVAGGGALAGSARLVLVDGAILLHPEPAVFEAILAGWRLQQESRLLAAATVDSRDKTLRRFQAFTGDYPWRWGPADIEEWSVSLRSAGRSRTTIRAYQNAVAMFCDFACDGRYGWATECEARFGEHPCQICHDWNTADHVADYEGDPARRPFTRDELQAFFDFADDRVAAARAHGPQGRVGGVARHGHVQGHLRVGAAPPGGGHVGHRRLLRQPGRAGARPVRDAVGALRQGDAGQPTTAAQRGQRHAVGGRGGAGVSGRGPPALRRAGHLGVVVDRTGRAASAPVT